MEFSEKLNILIKDSGKNRTLIAREMGISEANIRSWIKGSSPNIEMLKKLSKYFSITIDELLGNDITFTEDEKNLIKYYRTLDKNSQNAMLTLFNIKHQQDEGKSLISKIG